MKTKTYLNCWEINTVHILPHHTGLDCLISIDQPVRSISQWYPTSSSVQIPSTFNASQAMAFDGCFHDNEIELSTFPRMAPTLTSDPLTTPTQNPELRPAEGTRLRRQRSVRQNVDLLVNNSYMIDSYSRLAFPLSYLLFNTIYWSMYSWCSSAPHRAPGQRRRRRMIGRRTSSLISLLAGDTSACFGTLTWFFLSFTRSCIVLLSLIAAMLLQEPLKCFIYKETNAEAAALW